MKIVFFDKLRETHKSVDNVIQVNSVMCKSNGRLTNVWMLILNDGTQKSFKQKDFTIYRIEG